MPLIVASVPEQAFTVRNAACLAPTHTTFARRRRPTGLSVSDKDRLDGS